MKLQIYRLSVLLCTVLLIVSCKYDEGDNFSFTSKTNRVVGSYDLSDLLIDGVSAKNAYYNECEFSVFKDGRTFKESHEIINTEEVMKLIDGEWEFVDSYKVFKFREKDINSEEWGEWKEGKIIKLTKDEFWFECIDKLVGETIEVNCQYRWSKNQD